MVAGWHSVGLAVAGFLSSAGWYYFAPNRSESPSSKTFVDFRNEPNHFTGQEVKNLGDDDKFQNVISLYEQTIQKNLNVSEKPKDLGAKPTVHLEDVGYEAFATNSSTSPSIFEPPPSPRVEAKIKEVTLSDDNVDNLKNDRWIIFVYTDWCPNSQRLATKWKDFITTLKSLPFEKQIFVSEITIATHPKITSTLHIYHLPSFIFIDNGYRTHFSLNDLVLKDLSRDFFDDSHGLKLSKESSRLGSFLMLLSDWIGKRSYQFHSILLWYIYERPLLSYTFLAVLVGVFVSLHKSKIITIL